jgi:hypothetical protein
MIPENKYMKTFIAIFIVMVFFMTSKAQDEIGDPVSQSELAQISLPDSALRLREQKLPAEYQKLFARYFSADPSFRQGKSEFLAFGGGKTATPKLRNQIENSLRAGGWDYKVNPPENGVAFFVAVKKLPIGKGIFGYWVTTDTGLILAMTELLNGRSAAANQTETTGDSTISNQTESGNSQTFNLSASDENVNVMGERMPPLPSFPPLTKKPGKIRGYVKDTKGNLLRGAAIGLGSIRIGSSRVVTQTVTDTNGYYELDLALNSNKFHFAAYAVDYGGGKAAMALHPADGSIEDNPPGEGGVENFVLLPYGIADRAMLAENSNYGASFYGGSIALFINVGYIGGNDSINQGRFYPGSQIEITLTPLGALIDGSVSKTFVIRKKIGEDTRNELFINNVPVGKYKISIRSNGKPVGMKQRLPENSIFGIKPTQTNGGEADLLFYPSSGKPTEIGAGSGGWQRVEIYLEAL